MLHYSPAALPSGSLNCSIVLRKLPSLQACRGLQGCCRNMIERGRDRKRKNWAAGAEVSLTSTSVAVGWFDSCLIDSDPSPSRSPGIAKRAVCSNKHRSAAYSTDVVESSRQAGPRPWTESSDGLGSYHLHGRFGKVRTRGLSIADHSRAVSAGSSLAGWDSAVENSAAKRRSLGRLAGWRVVSRHLR